MVILILMILVSIIRDGNHNNKNNAHLAGGQGTAGAERRECLLRRLKTQKKGFVCLSLLRLMFVWEIEHEVGQREKREAKVVCRRWRQDAQDVKHEHWRKTKVVLVKVVS